MTAQQKRDGNELREKFKDALRALEYAPQSVDSMTLEFMKVSLRLTEAEKKAGVYHRYKDGKVFFRVKIAAPVETDETRTAVHALINNMRCDKTIRDKPFAIEFDTREPLATVTAGKIAEALRPRSPLALRLGETGYFTVPKSPAP